MSMIYTPTGLIDTEFDPEYTPEKLEDNDQNLLRWIEEFPFEKAIAAAMKFGVKGLITIDLHQEDFEQAYDDMKTLRPDDALECARWYVDTDSDAEMRYERWRNRE